MKTTSKDTKAKKPFVSHRTSVEALESLGRILRQRRGELGVTGTALAKMAGLSQSSLARLELGEREPHLEVLRRLHKLLDLKTPVLNFLSTGKF